MKANVLEDKKKTQGAIVVLVILHTVGVIGILSPWRELILMLTPINLLISCILLLSFHKSWSAYQIFVFVIFFTIGFLVEVLGVNTGLIFGEYEYGPVLGPQLWNTPLMIGVNWLMLLYATGVCAATLRIPKIAQVMVAATSMVALDFLIEPVAVKLNFWQWQGASIPVQNYAAWWVVSFGLHALQFYTVKLPFNKIAPWLLLIQALFFAALNLS